VTGMKKDLKIALAEDNRFHAILFEQAVREKYPDVEIRVFGTAREMLENLSSDQCNLIAVDYNLPDMDGLQLLSLIRAEKPDIPVIMITGDGSERTAVEAMKSGATDYIAKSGEYISTVPRVIEQACRKQSLIIKNRRLEARSREMEKLEAITTTASTLNHEVNNPLMSILGNIELLLEDPRLTDEEIISKLKVIMSSARRIKDITHKMTNLIEPTIRQTAAGPILHLRRGAEDSPRREDEIVPAGFNKSD